MRHQETQDTLSYFTQQLEILCNALREKDFISLEFS